MFLRTVLLFGFSCFLAINAFGADDVKDVNKKTHEQHLYPFHVDALGCENPKYQEAQYFQGIYYQAGYYCRAPWKIIPYDPKTRK